EKELTRTIRGCLAKLTAELAESAGIGRADVLEVTLVGNPIMHHLLLGIDPTPLGGAPFPLAVDEAVRMPARELLLPVHAGARAYVLPCIAGHVGADTAGGAPPPPPAPPPGGVPPPLAGRDSGRAAGRPGQPPPAPPP